MTLVKERLPGCNAESLDSYLRGLGFFLLAGEVEPSVRAWWDEDGVMWMASPQGVAQIASHLARRVRKRGSSGATSPRTPWKGLGEREDKGVHLTQARNTANEEDLHWLDSCALPIPTGGWRTNPVLFQGEPQFRSDLERGFQDVLDSLAKASPARCSSALVALLFSRPSREAQVMTSRKLFGPFQSGRATGPGHSSRDRQPTDQDAKTSAWDVVLLIQALRIFRGLLSRRPQSRHVGEASFPLVVHSRAVALPTRANAFREDSKRSFEFLAPLWSVPASPRTIQHAAAKARLRIRGSPAWDSVDAAVVQASNRASGLGFDRVARFAFLRTSAKTPQPPLPYATSRGCLVALGSRAAHLAQRDREGILPLLRRTEPDDPEKQPLRLRISRRRLQNALSMLAIPTQNEAQLSQEILLALAEFERAVALSGPPESTRGDHSESLLAPDPSRGWAKIADDRSPAYRLAWSLVAGLSDDGVCLLRETLLPQRLDEGRFVLDAARTPPDLERVSDPLAVLVKLALTALRRTLPENLARTASTSFSILASLLAGVLGEVGERRLALLCAALAGLRSIPPPPIQPEDPLTAGIGADVARLLLAAQPATDETAANALERTMTLASLLLAGRVDIARTMADRELRRRGLDLLPAPPRFAPAPRPQALALAVLLPFDGKARSALERAVSVSTTTPYEQGGVA